MDDERLRTDAKYRETFVNNMCDPKRLIAAKDKAFPYIGSLNSQDEFEVDLELAMKCVELRTEYERGDTVR